MAAIAESEENHETALTNYQTALKINPEDEEARKAYIYLFIKCDKYTEARTEIKKALDMNPENSIFYLLRGYLHRLNFRLDEAQADKKIVISNGADPSFASSFVP